MPRPRKLPLTLSATPQAGAVMSWAETLGEALGRGVARGINAGLSAAGISGGLSSGFSSGGLLGNTPRRRGRPPKAVLGVVPADRRCKVDGCPRPARSKGLCSAHYQAERRRRLGKA